MADDLNKTLEQFKDFFNNENATETLKMLAGILGTAANNGAQNESQYKKDNYNSDNSYKAQSTTAQEIPFKQNTTENNDMEDKINTIIKIKKVYDEISRVEDPRVNLLTALKPYLSPKRLSTLDNAIKVVHLSKLSSIINELDI